MCCRAKNNAFAIRGRQDILTYENVPVPTRSDVTRRIFSNAFPARGRHLIINGLNIARAFFASRVDLERVGCEAAEQVGIHLHGKKCYYCFFPVNSLQLSLGSSSRQSVLWEKRSFSWLNSCVGSQCDRTNHFYRDIFLGSSYTFT